MTGNGPVDTLLLIAAVITALTVIYRGGRSLLAIIRKIGLAYEWLRVIHHELSPNDGESIKDVIDRGNENDAILFRNIDRVYGELLHGRQIDPTAVPPLESLWTKEDQYSDRSS